MAGLRTYTIQEAENVDLGQLGSIYSRSTSTAVTPPDGHVIVAIYAISASKFSALTPEDTDKWISISTSSSGGGGTGGIAMPDSTALVSGQTIYGRWTSATLTFSTYGCIFYIGK